MRLVDWLYAGVEVAATAAMITTWLLVKIPARWRWWKSGTFLLLGVLVYFLTFYGPNNIEVKTMGWFITVMMLVSAFWRQGLANSAVIAALGATRIWAAITKVVLETHKDDTRLDVFVGSLRVSRLYFNVSPEVLQAFLIQHLPATAIIHR